MQVAAIAFDRFKPLQDDACQSRIVAAKAALGKRAVILGHHYQRADVYQHADLTGESLMLSKLASRTDADYIVFCGVHFMAEVADILSKPEQVVILPDMNAGCSMADMANIGQVEDCWSDLAEATDVSRITPITYVNSTAAIKAFVGRHGGACCTSSNARRIVAWALDRGDKLLFFPDQHLGRNTAVALGLDPERDMLLWDPNKPFGGNTPEQIRAARVILWKGHCSVHARFTVEEIAKARAEYPGVQVIVHPECSLEVVRAADFNGSTEHIINTISAAPPGTTWAVGTEINLVSRLAQEMPDKKIFCLDPVVCPCSTMYRIHPHFLLWTMESLLDGKIVNQVKVKPEIANEARLALNRMLEIS